MPLSERRRLQLRRISALVLGLGMVGIGSMHFVFTSQFEAIVPPFLPWATAIVYISGVAEIGLGLGMLLPRTRRLAAWGLVALYIAVYPANIYHAVANVPVDGTQAPLVYHLIRLPMQLVLIAWAWWHTRPDAPTRASADGVTSAKT